MYDVLTISGTGAMKDYSASDENNLPGWSYREGEEQVITSTIKYVNIGDGVTTIGNSAFRSCSKIESITIPASVTSIGNNAFSSCSGLKTVNFTDNSQLKTISARAFYFCKNLTTIDLAKCTKLETIGTNAFRSCSDKLESITIPASVKSIGEYAFSSCTKLKTVNFAEGSLLETIGNYAFNLCKNLMTIDLSECSKLTSIGGYAFQSCTLITAITIPASVTSIGEYAFSNCTGLKNAYVLPTDAPSLGDNTFRLVKSCSFYVHGNKYSNADRWKTLSNKTIIGTVTLGTDITATADADAIINYGSKNYYKEGTTFTLSYGGTDFVTLGGLPEGTTLNDVENQPMQRTFAMPAADVGLTITTVTGLTATSVAYDGQARTPEIKLGDNVFSTDNYTISDHDDWVNAGTYTCTLTGCGQYFGSKSVEFTIVPKPVETPTVSVGSGLEYTGDILEPDITVKDGETEIDPSEYNVSITDGNGIVVYNTVDATNTLQHSGTYTVAIADVDGGNYVISGSKEFTVAHRSISVSYIDPAADNQSCQHDAFVLEGHETTLGTNSTTTWYVAQNKLGDNNINLSSYGGITLNGDVNLVLADGSALTVNSIDIGGQQLTLYAQSGQTGKITATSYTGTGTINLAQHFVADDGTTANLILRGTAELDAISGKTLKPLSGYYVTTEEGISVTGKDTPDFTIGTTPYYIYDENAMVTLGCSSENYDCTYFVVNGNRIEGNTFQMPAKDVAVTGEWISVSGSCGTELKWRVSKSEGSSDYDVLTISGTGAMDATYSATNLPSWKSYRGNIKTVIINSGVTTIGSYAFNNSGSLKTVIFAEGSQLTDIGERAFNLCKELASVNLEECTKLESIGNSAFRSCALTAITIPASVISIDEFAFNNCSNLATINLVEGSQLETIGNSAFRSCPLTSLLIPAKVTTIGEYAFYNYSQTLDTHSQLKTVYVLPATVPTLGNRAFDDNGNCDFYFYGSTYSTTGGWSTLWSDLSNEHRSIIGTITLGTDITAKAKAVLTYDGISYYAEGTKVTLSNNHEGYSCTYAVNGTDIKGNTFKMPNQDVTVTATYKKLLTVKADDASVIYGAAKPTFTAIITGFIDDDDESVLGGELTFACDYARGANAGSTFTITPSGLTSDKYDIKFVAGTLTVDKASGSVLFKPWQFKKQFGDSDFTIYPSVSGGGTLTFSSDNPEIATVDTYSGLVSIVSTGTVRIYATLSGDDNYTGDSDWYEVEVEAADIAYDGGTITLDENGYDISLNESTGSAKPLPIDGHVDDLDYSRTLKVPEAGEGKGDVTIDGKEANLFTVCLPFEPTKMKENVTYYTLGSITGSTLNFTAVDNEDVAAFTPYLVAITGDSDFTLSCTAESYDTDDDIITTIVHADIGDFTFTGTLTGISNADAAPKAANEAVIEGAVDEAVAAKIAEAIAAEPGAADDPERATEIAAEVTAAVKDEITAEITATINATLDEGAVYDTYILQSGGKWGKVKKDTEAHKKVYIPPFRAFIAGPDINISAGARVLGSSFDGETVGIDSLRLIDRDGTERWYDLNGRRIEKPTRKGVYIHGGEKYILRR